MMKLKVITAYQLAYLLEIQRLVRNSEVKIIKDGEIGFLIKIASLEKWKLEQIQH